MAFLNVRPRTFLEQAAAVAEMRRRMLLHSLRSRQGRFDLGARIFVGVFFLALWLLVSIGEGFMAAQFALHGQLHLLPVLLWPVMVVWQIVPILLSMRSGAGFSILLRFPVSFASYLGLNLVFGFFELPTLLGGCMLLGVWIGLVVERPRVALPAAIVLVLFGLMNFVLGRMVFAWLERWLAERRTREILGTLTLFFFLGLQLVNPVLRHGSSWIGHSGPVLERWVLLMQKPLPPGMAAMALERAAAGAELSAAAFCAGLAAYLFLFILLLALRLRGEYRGERSIESAQNRKKSARGGAPRSTAWATSGKRPVFSGIFEKEWLYLRRSGVLLYSLAAPPFLAFFFVSARGTASQSPAYGEFALPLGAAYSFLGLTRLIYNSLGGEAAGLRLYFLSPTPIRTVLLAKNLFHVMLFLAEVIVVAAVICSRIGLPDPVVLAVTISWLLFALPLQLALGNLLSVTMGYRMTLTRLSREQGATGNGLLSLAIQMGIVAVGAVVYVPLLRMGRAALAVPVFLVMAAAAIWFWWSSGKNLDRVVFNRREQLLETIAR